MAKSCGSCIHKYIAEKRELKCYCYVWHKEPKGSECRLFADRDTALKKMLLRTKSNNADVIQTLMCMASLV